jgi:hypothetical protein
MIVGLSKFIFTTLIIYWFELAETLKIAKITYVTKIEIFSKIFFEKKIFGHT